MEKINLSEPDGTRQRWVDGAIRESAILGRAVSISEFVRRAVEAYNGGTDLTHRLGSAADAIERMRRFADGISVADARPVRSPIPKELQTRRRKG